MNISFLGNFGVSYSSESHHAKSLESLGHTVTRLQEGKSSSEEVGQVALSSDMFVWVHTHGWQTPGNVSMVKVLDSLKVASIPTVTYHLDLWFGLQRQKDLKADSFYSHIQHFFTVDKKMADWFNENTEVKGHYLQAGVFDQECKLATEAIYDGKPLYRKRDIIFVGSRRYHPEWVYRPQLIDWLGKTYGDNFTHVGGDGATGTVRGEELNLLYSNSKIAVGDSLCIGFNYPYYWSDRVYETLGRGGFLIHPYILGMEEHFTDKEHLVYYDFGNFNQLKNLIDYYLENEEEREAIRLAGHNHVKENHTYINRWQYILETVGLT